MLFYLLAFLVFGVDQLIKYFVHREMVVGQSVPLWDGIIKLTYIRNTGAAFSLFSGSSHFLIIVGLIVVLLVIYFYHKVITKELTLQIALAFILGGSLGNLLDRIFRSYVIDYIDVTIWPVFNFSDIMINLGVLLIIFELFLRGKKNVSGSI
jgi:signal peptidase II